MMIFRKKIKKYIKLFFCLLVIFINSCIEINNDSLEDKLIGTKINFMQHAVELHNIDSTQVTPNFSSDFKIVTYTDLYCYPCWQSAMPWRTHLNDFKQYPNVSFFCYVNALTSDFDKKNEEAKLDFPVFFRFSRPF
jgi:hypothetical protein